MYVMSSTDLPSMHCLLHWLHAGFKLSYVALLKNDHGIMMGNDDGTWERANGVWPFSTLEGKVILACHVHWRGDLDDHGLPKAGWTMFQKVDVPQRSFVKKLETERHTSRAVGGSTHVSSTGEILQPASMKGWHIIAQFIWF